MSGGIDSRIPLAGGGGPDIGAAVAQGLTNASSLMQLQQQRQQIERANKLRGILGAPDAIDPATGMPKTETISKAMSVDPAFGMKLGENAVTMQTERLRQNSLRSKASADQATLLNDTFSPIVLQYEEALKPDSKVPKQQAEAAAQKAWTEAREGLVKGGAVGPDVAQNIPTQWNYQDAKRRAMASDVYLTNLKRQDALQSEARKEKHDDQLNQRTGAALGTDSEGRAVFAYPNAPAGQRLKYDDDTPVPPEKQGGLHKMGTGGTGTAAALDQERIKRATQFTYEQEIGHPVASDAEKATLDQRVLDAEAKQKQASRSTSAPKADQERIANTTRFAYEKELGHPVDPNNPEEKAELDKRVLAAEDARGASQAGSKEAARQKAKADAGNQGVPDTPEERMATAAQLATGEPITQVIPGWGKDAAAARRQARLDAIQLIRDQNPQMSATEAGVELANRSIEFTSGRKSSGQLTTMLGATRQGVMQLDFNIDKTKQEMKKLGATNLSPILNAIYRGEERWTGNPAYTSLFYYMNATAMESARILSGGQASIQQLHEGARKEAERWININMTPASFDAVAKAIQDEGHYRVGTFEKALEEQRIGAPKGQQQDQKQWPAPNQKAQDTLKGDPKQAAMFDQAFGPGAAQRILGTQAPAAPAAAQPTPAPTQQPAAPAQPATPPPRAGAPVQGTAAAPLPLPKTEADLVDGGIYASDKGVVRFDKTKKRFFPVGGQ